MNVHLLEPPSQFWQCPNCDLEDVTHRVPVDGEAMSRFHSCPGVKGLTAPMIPAGTKAKIEAHEREDYIGGDLVQTDGDGRPIMNLVTTRDDGTDLTVFAPCAATTIEEH